MGGGSEGPPPLNTGRIQMIEPLFGSAPLNWAGSPSPTFGWFQTLPSLGTRAASTMSDIATSPQLTQVPHPQSFGLLRLVDVDDPQGERLSSIQAQPVGKQFEVMDGTGRNGRTQFRPARRTSSATATRAHLPRGRQSLEHCQQLALVVIAHSRGATAQRHERICLTSNFGNQRGQLRILLRRHTRHSEYLW
jgi:hypothetical protein